VKLLEPFGVEFTPEVKAMMMGRKDLEAAEVMIKHYGLEGKLDPADFIENRNRILEELFPKCQLMPGQLFFFFNSIFFCRFINCQISFLWIEIIVFGGESFFFDCRYICEKCCPPHPHARTRCHLQTLSYPVAVSVTKKKCCSKKFLPEAPQLSFSWIYFFKMLTIFFVLQAPSVFWIICSRKMCRWLWRLRVIDITTI